MVKSYIQAVGRLSYSSDRVVPETVLPARKSASNGGLTKDQTTCLPIAALSCSEVTKQDLTKFVYFIPRFIEEPDCFHYSWDNPKLYTTGMESKKFVTEGDLKNKKQNKNTESPEEKKWDSDDAFAEFRSIPLPPIDGVHREIEKVKKNIKISHREFKRNGPKRDKTQKIHFFRDYLPPEDALFFDEKHFPGRKFAPIPENRMSLFKGWEGYLYSINEELSLKDLPLMSALVFTEKEKVVREPVNTGALRMKLNRMRGRRLKDKFAGSRFVDRVFSPPPEEVEIVDNNCDFVEMQMEKAAKKLQRSMHNALEKTERIRKAMAKHAKRLHAVSQTFDIEKMCCSSDQDLVSDCSLATDFPVVERLFKTEGEIVCYCKSKFHNLQLCNCYLDWPKAVPCDDVLNFLSPQELDLMSSSKWRRRWLNFVFKIQSFDAQFVENFEDFMLRNHDIVFAHPRLAAYLGWLEIFLLVTPWYVGIPLGILSQPLVMYSMNDENFDLTADLVTATTFVIKRYCLVSLTWWSGKYIWQSRFFTEGSLFEPEVMNHALLTEEVSSPPCRSRFHDRRLCTCYYDMPNGIMFEEILSFLDDGDLDATGLNMLEKLKHLLKISFTSASELLVAIWEKIKRHLHIVWAQLRDFFATVAVMLHEDWNQMFVGWRTSALHRSIAIGGLICLFYGICTGAVEYYPMSLAIIMYGLSGVWPWQLWFGPTYWIWSLALLTNLFPPRQKKLAKSQKADDVTILTEGNISTLLEDWVLTLSNTLDSVLVVNIRTALQKLLSFKIFPKHYVHKMVNHVGPPIRTTTADVLLDIINLGIHVIRSFELWSLGFPLMSTLLSSNPVDTFITSMRELLTYRDFLYVGLPVEHKMCRVEFARKLAEGVSFIESYKKSVPKSHPTVRVLTNLVIELKHNHLSVRAEIAGGQRAVPYAICLVGKPGTGKSRLVQHIASANAAVRNRPYYPNEIFARNPGAEFWDGYDMFSTMVIVFPELGNTAAAISKSKQEESFVEILSIIDNNQYFLNMAKLEDKGKTLAMPQLAIAHTNNETLNAEHQVMNKAAYYRRFNLWVEVEVKPQFRRENSCMIDVDKALASEDLPLDRYMFSLYRHIPEGNSASHVEYVLNRVDIYAFTEFLEADMCKHIAQQEEVIAKTSNPLDYNMYRPEAQSVFGTMFCEGLLAKSKYFAEIVLEKFDEWAGECTYLIGDWVAGLFGSIVAALIVNKVRVWANNNYNVIPSYIFYFLLLLLFSTYILSIPITSLVLAIFLLKANNFPSILGCVIWFYDRHDVLEERWERYVAKRKLLKEASPSGDSLFNSILPVRSRPILKVLGAIATGLTAYNVLAKIFKKKVCLAETEGNNMSTDIVPESDLLRKEDLLGCGKSYVRVASKRANVWNVQNKEIPAANTLELPDFSTLIAKNVRAVEFVPTKGATQKAHILGIKGNWVLTNKHLLGFGGIENCLLKISTTCDWLGQDHSVEARPIPGSVHEIAPDLVMFKIGPCVFRDITMHIVAKPFANPPSIRGSLAFKPVITQFMSNEFKVGDRADENVTYIVKGMWTYPSTNGNGLCGWPLVVQHGRGCSIVGIHSGGNGKIGCSQYITQDMLDFTDNSCHLAFCSEGLTMDLLEPHPKSLLHYENLGSITYYGRIPGKIMAKNRSRLERLVEENNLLELFYDNLNFVPQVTFGKPMMNPSIIHNEYVSPWNVGVREMQRSCPAPTYSVLDTVIEELSSQIIGGLEEKGVTSLSPLTSEVAINGVAHDPFIRRVNVSTAGGFGWKGNKEVHLPIDETRDDWVTRIPTAELSISIDAIIAKYLAHEMVHPIYTAHLKDEPRPLEKILAGKTRLFYGSPVDFLIVSRMFLAPIYSLMTEFGDVFYTGIGLNMHTEADDLVKELLVFSGLLFDGDIKSFDLALPYWIREAAAQIVCNVALRFGYSKEALKVLKGILTDALFPTINILQDILLRCGIQPSGAYGTAEFNSLSLLVALYYLFKIHEPTKHMKFKDSLLPRTYGDDLLCAIKVHVVKVFDNLVLRDLFKKHMNVTYTAGDKNATMVACTTIDKVTFLKRSFVQRDGKWIAPLDLNSCFKMLEWYIPSNSCPINSQVLSTVRSNLWEMYLHLEEVPFGHFKDNLILLVKEQFELTEIDISKIPSYENIKTRMENTDVPLSIGMWEEDVREQEERQIVVYVPSGNFVSEGNLDDEMSKSSSNQVQLQELDQLFNEVNTRMGELTLQIEALTSVPVNEALNHALDTPRIYARSIHKLLIEYRGLTSTRKSILRLQRKRRQLMTFPNVMTEGEVVGSVADMNKEIAANTENLVDSLGAPSLPVSASEKIINYNAPTTNKELGDFLKRPVQLTSFSVVPGATPVLEVEVWADYTAHPSVRAKFRNFAFMRGELHLRVVVSGSPFHYGKVLLSYQPHPLRNTALQALLTSRGISALFTPLVRNYLSQSEGAFVMDVKENQPVELTCPFIAPKPINRLFNSSALVLADTAAYADFDNFGSLFIEGLNNVGSVSTTPSDITFYVYAWMENVEVAGLTGTQIDITTEGKLSKGKGENQMGPIQWAASKAVAVSKALSYVPEIAPLAMASEMMFGSIGKFASIFGWSRPLLENTSAYFKNLWYTSGALTSGHDSALKIGLDVSQELTVDMSPFGSKCDEMSITYIADRTSYWHYFTWATTDTPMVTMLEIIPIYPFLTTVHTSLASHYMQPTAMCYAATPFQYWRGDITITIQLVASAFHRGKYAIFYEPNGWQNVLIDAAIEPNKQYMRIIDIQEVQDVQFTIKWNSHRDWLENPGKSNYIFPGVTVASISEYINGFVGITPVTSIQSPDGSSVDFNVYVGCSNLQVNGFTSNYLPLERDIVTEGSLVQSPIVDDLNESGSSANEICYHNFGERPLTFRALLKRFVTYHAELGAVMGARGYTAITEAIYPDPSPKYDATAVTYTTLYSYLRYAYLGMRGSMRRRYRALGPATSTAYDGASVSLEQATSSHLAAPSLAQGTLDATTAFTVGASKTVGTVIMGLAVNGGYEVDIPHYSPNFFCFSCANGLVGTNNTDEMNNKWFRNIITTYWTLNASSTAPLYTSEIATGEDFTMFRFLGAPYWSQPNV